jgi:hypothetical protein
LYNGYKNKVLDTLIGDGWMQRLDLAGRRFGRLMALEYIPEKKKWRCVCDCGTEKLISKGNLSSGATRSCGCLGPTRPHELTGHRFGHWTVLEHIFPGKWLCRCDCGNEAAILTDNLTRGKSRSCGCQKNAAISKAITKHGKVKTKTYRAWGHLKGRCLNPGDRVYALYGGRGITVCDRWLNSFENFLADMGEPPTKAHSIDRINCDGNYEPGNCRWATSQGQALNQRRNRYFSLGDESHTLTEWAEIKGISYTRLYQRIAILKWPLERAITQP